jgi:putative membrane protein
MTEGSRLHPLTLFFEAIRVARSFILPAVVGGASVGGDDFSGMFRWAIAFLAVPALVTAGAKYASFRYRLGEEEIVLDSGVLRRNRRVIPLSRVQHIDVRQSALQRLAGVAELRVETAGGDRTEAELNVLGLRQAEELRAELLARRRAASAGADARAGAGAVPAEPPATLLARLGTGRLALAGATSNEAGLVAALLGGAFNLLLQSGIDLPTPDIDPETMLPESPALMVAVVVGVVTVVFLVLGWLFSIVGAVVRYHGFTLEQTSKELRKRFGLLSRQEAFVPLRRIQTVRVEESLLRRTLGLAALKVETAGGASPGQGRRGGAEAFVPLADAPEVPRLVHALFEELDYDALTFHPVHPRARLRAFFRFSLPVVAAAAGLAIWQGVEWLGLLALLPLAFGAAHLRYRSLGWALAPGFVVARAGFLTRVTWVVPEWKIQTLHVRQTPFQRRHRLATLLVDTAAGQAAIVDLHRDDADALLERIAPRAAARRPAPAPEPAVIA